MKEKIAQFIREQNVCEVGISALAEHFQIIEGEVFNICCSSPDLFGIRKQYEGTGEDLDVIVYVSLVS